MVSKTNLVCMLTSLLLAGSGIAQTLELDVEQSQVFWMGKKFSGEHSGTIQLRSGTITFAGDRLVSGNFLIDMTSIRVTDIKDPEMNAKLERHLKNDDFFAVDRYGSSRFTVLEATFIANEGKGQMYTISGDLEIKGISHPLEFSVWIVRGQAAVSARGEASVDRTLYDIRYKSSTFFPEIGNRAIDDAFEIRFELMTRTLDHSD